MRDVAVLCVVLCLTITLKPLAEEIVLFSDGFENYNLGVLPANWTIVWNGRGDEAQVVTNECYASGTRSFRLWGQPGWSAVVQRRFSTTARIIGYEFKILLGERGSNGQEHPGFFKQGAEGNVWGTYYAVVIFDHADGKIKAEDGRVLGAWEPGKWYTVRVVFDRQNKTYDVRINGVLVGSTLAINARNPELIDSLALTSGHAGKKVFYDDVKVFYMREEALGRADWTVMIYACADDSPDKGVFSLEGPILRIINQIEKVGSTNRVHVVALIDRIKGYDTTDGDWSDTRLYYLIRDSDEKKINSMLLQQGTEEDMSSFSTLQNFIVTAGKRYPANHYLLIILGHGHGWHLCKDSTPTQKLMTALGLAAALRNATTNLGIEKIDILFLFTCTNAMVELMYSIAGFTDYVIAPETLISTEGAIHVKMKWEQFMENLTRNPHWPAEKVVDALFEAMELGLVEAVFTAFKGDLRYWKNLCSNIDQLARILIEALPHLRKPIYDARFWTYEVKGPLGLVALGFVDLYHLCRKLSEKITEPRLGPVLDAICAYVESAVVKIKSNVWTSPVKGLSIFFPLEGPDERWKTYKLEKFATDTYWDEFLNRWWSITQMEFSYGPSGWYLVSVPTIGDRAMLFDRLYYWNGTTYDVLEGNDPILPTRGYWAYLKANHTVRVQGAIPEVDQIIELPAPGWHLISVPWKYDRLNIEVKRHGEVKTWRDAVSAGWIGSKIWGYEPQHGYGAVSILIPWYGYWIKSNVDGISLLLSYSKRLELQEVSSCDTIMMEKSDELAEEPPEVPRVARSLSSKTVFAFDSNPINSSSMIFKSLIPLTIELRATVYDLTGRVVWEGTSTGHELTWNKTGFDGNFLANGIYLCRVCIKLVNGELICSGVEKLIIQR